MLWRMKLKFPNHCCRLCCRLCMVCYGDACDVQKLGAWNL